MFHFLPPFFSTHLRDAGVNIKEWQYLKPFFWLISNPTVKLLVSHFVTSSAQGEERLKILLKCPCKTWWPGMSYRSSTAGNAVIVSSTSLPWRAALCWRQGKKCEQDFTNLAYGRASAEAGSGSAATNYREEHHSEHNETLPAPGHPAHQAGLLEGQF